MRLLGVLLNIVLIFFTIRSIFTVRKEIASTRKQIEAITARILRPRALRVPTSIEICRLPENVHGSLRESDLVCVQQLDPNSI